MRLGIDASNIRAGGGVTHLVELLRAADPLRYGFDQVIVWGGTNTLQRIEDRPWLQKIHDSWLDRSLPFRLYWQRFKLDRMVETQACDLLFIPGGSYGGGFRPFVTMSQNLLPFQWSEARRYGYSGMYLKLIGLHLSQSKTMRRAEGTIFLTNFARDVVTDSLGQTYGLTKVIPHGVNKMFEHPPRPTKPVEMFSPMQPFRVLYISIVTVYKHQWHVAEAIASLRKRGLPMQLELIGPAYGPALKRLLNTLAMLDPKGEFTSYRGSVSYENLYQEYQQADIFVFASTCETFGQIVTEAMSAGLPIVCADTGTMRELMEEDAIYFNAEKPEEIAAAIEVVFNDPVKRRSMAYAAYKRSQHFTWEKCAQATFDFLAQFGQENR